VVQLLTWQPAAMVSFVQGAELVLTRGLLRPKLFLRRILRRIHYR